MFTRTELELLRTSQLKILCNRYGLKPTGNPAYKTSFITTLMAFPVLAIHQLEEGKGLKSPSFGSLQEIGTALDEMGSPTLEQSALIRISFEGRRMQIPARYDQERLLTIYKAKSHLEEVINLLTI
jgi:phosphopentomutase